MEIKPKLDPAQKFHSCTLLAIDLLSALLSCSPSASKPNRRFVYSCLHSDQSIRHIHGLVSIATATLNPRHVTIRSEPRPT